MPIFEYRCTACAEEFERLVRGSEAPECPACGETKVDRLLSLPRVKSSSTRAMAMRAAKQRDKNQGADRTRERVEYEANHD